MQSFMARPYLSLRLPRLSEPLIPQRRISGRATYRKATQAAARGGAGCSQAVVEGSRNASPQQQQQQQLLATFDAALSRGDVTRCLQLLKQQPGLQQQQQQQHPSSSRSSNGGSHNGRKASYSSSANRQHGGGGTALGSQRQARVIDACFSARQPSLALEFVTLLPPGDGQAYNQLLRACGKHRNLSLLPEIQAARAAAGLQPDSYSQAAVITALSSVRQLDEALEVFRQSWEWQSCRTLGVCNAAIGACAAQGDWGGAQQALALLRQAGIPPDIVTYNSLIKAAGAAGAMPEVLRLYEELQEDGLAPTAVTFTALFTAAARNQHQDVEWLHQVYADMGRAGVALNDYVLSAYFSAASFCARAPADLEACFAALALYRAQGARPNDTVFTALLMLCTRAGIADRAVDVWTAVQEDGVPFSPHLFSALFKACTAGTSPALVDVAMQAYHDMHMWWTAHKAGPGSAKFQRDMLVAYNALLHFIGEMAQLDEALAVFEVMQRTGPRPDVVTFNTMIAACSHLGDAHAALKMFGAMADAGITPTEPTFGALLNTYAKARNVPSARLIFDSLQGCGMRPNLQMYTAFMDACVKEGSPASLDLSFALLERMRGEGLQPTAVTYGCLLVACERLRDVDRAFKLYQDACDEGVLPTDECHNVLISVCTEAERLDEALDLVKRLARKHGTMQQHTLNSLTRALCPKYVDRALRMLSLTQTLGLKPTRRTYIALIDGCARASKSDAAYQLYKSLRAQGMEADGVSGSALIVSLCHASQLELAVKVYDDMLACAWRKELQLKDVPLMVAQKGGLSKRAQIPDASALSALTQAFAARHQLRQAHKYYKQLRRDFKGLVGQTLANRRMFELLIENLCRARNVKLALQVFDDWKGASGAWFAMQGAEEAKGGRFPKLSNVSLAFLEACCRSEPKYEWRVYDVCAVMRQQKERKVEAKLARPAKRSHHFFDSSEDAP